MADFMEDRSYQIELMKKAQQKNLIVCLPTGSGKTYIAILLIKEWAHQVRDVNGKRTVIIVQRNELGRQHAARLEGHVDLKVKNFCEGTNIKTDSVPRWEKEIREHQILIFIGQKFLNLLEHGIIDLSRVNLLILDECHHASGDDAYARILKGHYHQCKDPPRILGLTASISSQKIEASKLPKLARELEKLYQATIETGSDHSLILKNSTCVKPIHDRCDLCKNATVLSIVKDKIQRWINDLETFLKDKKTAKQVTTDESTVNDSRRREIPFSCSTFDKLKNHLENLIYVGCELGFSGLLSAIEALRRYLDDSSQFVTRITDQDGKHLCQKIIHQIDELIDEMRKKKPTNESSLYSGKVLKVRNRLTERPGDRCIVFVDRIYIAAFLTKVLNELLPTMKIQYIAGSKLQIDDLIRLTPTYQRNVMDKFRENRLDVLISTAIMEEGIDVQACNLVIRFNKPQNFSSYMQSKGRARAKTGARFIILHDESNAEQFAQNKEEFRNYEELEEMLRRNFRDEFDADYSSPSNSDDDDDDNSLRPYRPNDRVRIGAVTAVQTIHQYCAMLSPGQSLSPVFLFDAINSNLFQCTLIMPSNCPIRDDIVCKSPSKKTAKRQCCLIMLEKLHQIGELTDSCLPIRHEDEDDDDDTDDQPADKGPKADTYSKQTSYLTLADIPSRAHWHVYRIVQSNTDELGFITPIQLPKLPSFLLYDRLATIPVEIRYVKSILREKYDKELEEFSRYIFEKTFTGLYHDSMTFDIFQSKCPFLLCLLARINSPTSNEIDWKRMADICQRMNKKVTDPSQLDDKELYYLSQLNPPMFVTANLDLSAVKLASDRWEFKRKDPKIETYADHFEDKYPPVRIRRDFQLCTAKIVQKPRKFYLTPPTLKEEKDAVTQPLRIEHYPIELLEYAPLNQRDQQLISRYPSLLTRIVQLYHLTQLEEHFQKEIQDFPLFDRNQPIPIDFRDGLGIALKKDVLPMVSFHYPSLFSRHQPFPSTLSFLFQATTRRSCAEQADLENLEILGDCFLKLSMSLSLYHQIPSGHSGILTRKKDHVISNKYLYNLATEKNLKRFLSADRVIFTGKEANWLPPCYTSNDDKYTKQNAKRKAFSDMIEALIGAFLIITDYGTTIKMMNSIGLPTVPRDENGQLMKSPTVLGPANVTKSQIDRFYTEKNFSSVERSLKYDFKDKALLIAAMTHPSYLDNRLTICYERLEYLGDAVLDFLVVRNIFVRSYDRVTPSHVTDMRQDLANNGRLAHIIVQLHIHESILYSAADIFYQTELYINDESIFPKSNPDKAMDPWGDSRAPKMLADVFEALVGAIFVDSNYSLLTVWQVIEPLLQQYIERSLEHPNLNPIRFFNEKQGQILEWKENPDGTYICRAQLPEGSEHIGQGKNKKLAKFDACRKAVQEQQSNC